MKEIHPSTLIDLIDSQRYGVEYQPIIGVSNNETYAYEALSRFYDESKQAIAPDTVYAALHDSPLSLFQVEYQQKCIQLSSAPNNERIFINLDQDSYFASGIATDDNPFLQLFNSHLKNDITVELIENSHINDAKMSLEMIKVMLSNNIKSAIDDVFAPLSMLSLEVIQFVDYIKLDKCVVQRKNDKQFIKLVELLIEHARFSDKEVILEGIENKEDLAFASTLGVDYVQGFLFKDRFITYSN
ncbi:MAG: EAL domain-containing protein [Cycloclasticus sp.]|nr:EAL domain-containing protein [Cycloclasticus sp. 44_32_T64]